MILPMTFNIGVIIGPILGRFSRLSDRLLARANSGATGGLLADPVGSYPSVFGPGSALGGKDGVHWMTKWPYALPNLVSAFFLLNSALALSLGLEEVKHPIFESPHHR